MKQAVKYRRLWVRARSFFGDNFVMVAGILLALWFIVVWTAFGQGNIKSEELTAYAMFGTALATLLLAVATAFMARETKTSRKLTETLTEENRKLAEAPRIRELITRGVNPLVESVEKIKGYHERREYDWITTDLGVAKELLGGDQDVAVFQRGDFQHGYNHAFFPHPWITVEQHAGTFQALNEALYGDLGRMHPSLIDSIQKYDKKAEDFMTLLLDLAKAILSQESEERGGYGKIWERYMEGWGSINGFEMQALTLSVACLTFNNMLGASEKFSHEQVKSERHRDFWREHKDFIIEKITSRNVKDKAEHMAKDADDLAEELRGIEAELSQIKNRYRDEYHLTHGETKGQETKPHVV
jgi:hypothetical protein